MNRICTLSDFQGQLAKKETYLLALLHHSYLQMMGYGQGQINQAKFNTMKINYTEHVRMVRFADSVFNENFGLPTTSKW